MIGNVSTNRTLSNLGSSVSLMPYSILKRLGLGELSPTCICFQLANRFIKYPMGILEDVPIKMGNFYVPLDLVVLDMAKDSRTKLY